MASYWENCGVCDYRHITKPSLVWCSECDEGLCKDCNEHHKISKATRNHDIVSSSEYKKLPTKILEVAQSCKAHDQKYELFCKNHDCPCCKKCLERHDGCKGLTDINNIIHDVKLSSAFQEIEQSVHEVAENIKSLRFNREKNLATFTKKRSEIEMSVKEIRKKINDHLDEIQDNMLKELKTTEEKESSKIRQLISSLKRKEEEISDLQNNISNIKKYASELQTFLAIKQIEEDVKKEENYIQSIVRSDICTEIDILLSVNTILQNFKTTMQTFGEISVLSDESTLSLQSPRQDKQAQIMVAIPQRNIENLKLTLKKRVSTRLINVRGCSLLPDDKMAFTCYTDYKLLVLKPDGSEEFCMSDIGETYDVVYIRDNSVAVTSGGHANSRQINIINIKNKKSEKILNVFSSCHGVVSKDKALIYCAEMKGIQKIRINNNLITTVSTNKMTVGAYVTTLGNTLYYTNKDKDSVNCCDFEGKSLWVFKNETVLSWPTGISVDSHGNVYVVGYNSCNVVVISPDGKRYKVLLSQKDGLDDPQCLHYNRSDNKLLVANTTNEAFVYDVNG